MTGEERRQLITIALRQTEKPISASAFAVEYGVSRQVIVGDVALIRANGLEVRATSRGYILTQGMSTSSYRGQVVCQHTEEQTGEELTLIVENGGKVIDVSISHPIYGELTGNLDLATKEDVEEFLLLSKQVNSNLLSTLTSGIHIHTIETKNIGIFRVIKEKLKKVNFLF